MVCFSNHNKPVASLQQTDGTSLSAVAPDSPCSNSIHRSSDGGAPPRDDGADGDGVAGDDGDGMSSSFHRRSRSSSSHRWSPLEMT